MTDITFGQDHVHDMTPLEKSIKHWEANVAAELPNEASTAASDCALCVETPGLDCGTCPVKMQTGKIECEGTPYGEARDALSLWNYRPSNLNLKLKAAFRKAAQEELDFLKGLLP
jgi:hypothetical protein